MEFHHIVEVEKFIFETPLYKQESKHALPLHVAITDFSIDGHCPYCRKNATFHSIHQENNNIYSENEVDGTFPRIIYCTRNPRHILSFYFFAKNDTIQKIGQFPSFADIANDESLKYRKYLSRLDAQELHKAIGLASHGVGVGSFVYLRRIFERIIKRRFEENKNKEKWKDEEFLTLRMDEKIDLLKGHLPDYLVKNRKIYSILSKGHT